MVRFDDRVLVFSTDPITGATKHIGRHAVHVNANDVAVTGARPLWFLCTILVPPGSTEQNLKGIMNEVHLEAKKLGVMVIRGHTEATPGLKHPIIAGFMIGESKSRQLFTPGGTQQGDHIIITKTAGIEGTAVLAADYSKLLKKKGVDEPTIRRAGAFMNRISIVPEAHIAASLSGVTAMHDPTEGGLLNGLWELGEASGRGIEVDAELIPVAPETRKICDNLGLDPLKLLGSGSLVIACRPTRSASILGQLKLNGISAIRIGHIKRRRNDRTIFRNGRVAALVPVPRDELYSV